MSFCNKKGRNDPTVIAAEFLPLLFRPRAVRVLGFDHHRLSGSYIWGFRPSHFAPPSQFPNDRLAPRTKHSCIYSAWLRSGLQPDFLIPNACLQKTAFTRNVMKRILYINYCITTLFLFPADISFIPMIAISVT